MNKLWKSIELEKDAQLVIEVLSEKEAVELDYSADSVSWLDAYIDQHRAELDASDKAILQEKFGAFLGESIRRLYGGKWVRSDENSWLIDFGGQGRTSPFEIIGEHLDHHTPLSQVFAQFPDRI